MQQDFPQNPMTIKILCFHLCQAGCIFYDLHIFYDLPVKKILVVQAEQLLGAAIISLLSTECDLNLMGCMADTNAELIERIIHLHPDVLIMAQADQFIEAIHLLLASPGFKLCLIWISIDHNWVHIDNKKQILITGRADLANIIRYGQIQPTGEIFNQNHDHNNLISL